MTSKKIKDFVELKQELKQYLPQEQLPIISKAYDFAYNAHLNQYRADGAPYIAHPVAVAKILASMKMDYSTIAAAILHDVLEDSDATKKNVEDEFGAKIAELVDGVSKLSIIKFKSKAEAQAESLRKMMLAMSNDIRVIIIKLADRLHNMRTLDFLSSEKQRQISLETLEIYAPIAYRLGMNNFKLEFEDLGFSYLYPMRFRVLKDAVSKELGDRNQFVEKLESSIRKRLSIEKIRFIDIYGREKHIYSIYKKMKKKRQSLSEILDIYAIRVITETTDDCYRALGVIHSVFKPIHGRFKDYIAVPKSNGYHALHTCVLGPNTVPVEVQIKTKQMFNLAEHGIAAHWAYKNEGDFSEFELTLKARRWLQGFLDTHVHTENSREFIENVKIDLHPEEVYLFTPDGEIVALNQGATPIDFAYMVHSDIGNSCIACKVDRKLSPLNMQLRSGQTVEIITAKGSHPNPGWLNFVVTAKARNSIRHWLRTQQTNDAIVLGKKLLSRALSSLSHKLDDKNIPNILNKLNVDSMNKLFCDIGQGHQIPAVVARKIVTDNSHKEILPDSAPIAITGAEGMSISYAKCCNPIPGDVIVGSLTTGRGLVIHREVCKNIKQVSKAVDKFIYVRWDEKVAGYFNVCINVEAKNIRGVLALVASIIASTHADIIEIEILDRTMEVSKLLLTLQVKNRYHLSLILRKLSSAKQIIQVQRSQV